MEVRKAQEDLRKIEARWQVSAVLPLGVLERLFRVHVSLKTLQRMNATASSLVSQKNGVTSCLVNAGICVPSSTVLTACKAIAGVGKSHP